MRRAVIASTIGVALGAFGITLPAAAAPDYPAADGRCVDTAAALGGLCSRINSVLLDEEQRYPEQIAVAVVPATNGYPIEEWSTGLFNTWGVGRRGADNGVLLVVAVNEHRLRIATGRGVAERLTEARGSEIVNGTITPRFTAGSIAEGVLCGLDEIRRALGHTIGPGGELGRSTAQTPPAGRPVPPPADPAGPPGQPGQWPVAEPDGYPDESGSSGGGAIGLLVLFAVIVVIIGLARGAGGGSWSGSRPRSGDRTWRTGGWSSRGSSQSSSYLSGGSGSSSSSSGSSSSSFGGGSSDGGGSSGSW
jgi:uncharacterized protein